MGNPTIDKANTTVTMKFTAVLQSDFEVQRRVFSCFCNAGILLEKYLRRSDSLMPLLKILQIFRIARLFCC